MAQLYPRPLLLDLFCCQGGASAGYRNAGFEVMGVDLYPQPKYPWEFVMADAVEFLRQLLDGQHGGIRRFSAVHASPPCQRKSKAQRIRAREHPALIGPIRELLIESGLPYVIENVVPEDVGLDDDPLLDPRLLCGAMFGLRTYRHREFESNIDLKVPAHPVHAAKQVKMGRAVQEGEFYQAVGNFSNVQYARRDMGLFWMNRDGIRESIPPAYSEFVGGQLLAVL